MTTHSDNDAAVERLRKPSKIQNVVLLCWACVAVFHYYRGEALLGGLWGLLTLWLVHLVYVKTPKRNAGLIAAGRDTDAVFIAAAWLRFQAETAYSPLRAVRLRYKASQITYETLSRYDILPEECRELKDDLVETRAFFLATTGIDLAKEEYPQ